LKHLEDILNTVDIKQIIGTTIKEINGMALNSKNCKANYLFVAIVGTDSDGHRYIANAIENMATVILCSSLPEDMPDAVTFVLV